MSKPVNLNMFRKFKERKKKSSVADANAIKFGRRKEDKHADVLHIKKQAHHLNLHKRER